MVGKEGGKRVEVEVGLYGSTALPNDIRAKQSCHYIMTLMTNWRQNGFDVYVVWLFFGSNHADCRRGSSTYGATFRGCSLYTGCWKHSTLGVFNTLGGCLQM